MLVACQLAGHPRLRRIMQGSIGSRNAGHCFAHVNAPCSRIWGLKDAEAGAGEMLIKAIAADPSGLRGRCKVG